MVYLLLADGFEEIEALTGQRFFPTLPYEAKKQKNALQWGL